MTCNVEYFPTGWNTIFSSNHRVISLTMYCNQCVGYTCTQSLFVRWERSKNKILLADHCACHFAFWMFFVHSTFIVNEDGSLVLFLKGMLDKHLRGIHFARLLYKYLLYFEIPVYIQLNWGWGYETFPKLASGENVIEMYVF